MQFNRKVLVTGAAGYIGSVLVNKLLAKGYHVWGLDALLFGDVSLAKAREHPDFRFFQADLRDRNSIPSLLSEVDAVIHLAAIVGDPACSRTPDLARETNGVAAKTVYDLAEKAKNVKRFIFASTCSNYGKADGQSWVDETSPLKPVSLYARLKVEFEQYMLTRAVRRSDFVPTVLRFATAYGLSPRMRFDLTVNEFSRDVATQRDIKIYGERFWRPYGHVHDLAEACILVLESDASKVGYEVFNVGHTSENYTKKHIAEMLRTLDPAANFIPINHAGEDPRDYRVNFDKIRSRLGYSATNKVKDGIFEVYHAVKSGLFGDPYAHAYSNS